MTYENIKNNTRIHTILYILFPVHHSMRSNDKYGTGWYNRKNRRRLSISGAINGGG